MAHHDQVRACVCFVAQDPWMPACVTELLTGVWNTVWPEVVDAIREDFLEER